jgi:hypothetical protein
MPGRLCRPALLAVAAAVAVSVVVRPVNAGDLTVESLLKDGWEIAGFASNFEGRSLILFKHKDKGYLAQCSVLYDVTRSNRVVINCYEVR